jgi:aspartate-semialdehyde dehydrogenase
MAGTRPEPLVVAVVGATGAVARTMTQVLLEHDFPMPELRLLPFRVVSDNLRKGAASNAVELAGILAGCGRVRRASERVAVGATGGRPA